MISTSGAVRRNPNAQIMSTQRTDASGRGHQMRISLDRDLSMRSGLLVFDGYQKVLRTRTTGTQHRLHDNSLRCVAVCRYHHFLFGIAQ